MFGIKNIKFADFVGGAAKSFDERLKEDLRRTDERAENTAKERMALRDANKKTDKEFTSKMESYANGIKAVLGAGATGADAVRVIKAYGGDLLGAERAYNDFTESDGVGIDVATLVDHSMGQDDGTLKELVSSLRPVSSTRLLEEGELMGSGFLKKVDLGEQVNKQVPIDDDERKTYDIGTATIDRSKLKSGLEFTEKMKTDPDKYNTTYTALHAKYTQQIEELDPVKDAEKIKIIQAKRDRSHTEWLKFQTDKDKKNGTDFSRSAITTIVKTGLDLANSKYLKPGIDGKMQLSFEGNHGVIYQGQLETFDKLAEQYKDLDNSLFNQIIKQEKDFVLNEINKFKTEQFVNFNREKNAGGDLTSYSKFKDFSATPTPSGYNTMEDYINAEALKGKYNRNSVIQFTNKNGSIVRGLWTGNKFI